MKHNEAMIQKLGVNPASWDWFNKDYSKYTEKPEPAPKEQGAGEAKFIPVPFTIAVVLLLGYAAAFLYPWFTSGVFPTASAIGGSVLLSGIICCVFGLLMPGAVIVGFALILALLDFLTGHVGEGFLFLGAIAGGFVAVALFIYSLPIVVRNEPRHPFIDVSEQGQRVFGAPGGVGSAVSKFGASAVHAGVAGEKSTAALLELLLKIPGVIIYHGLKFPGSETADVDHAVVHGRRVFLIDSKQYRSGSYRWGNLVRDGWKKDETIEGGGHKFQNHMFSAHKGFQEMLGRKVILSSIVLIHGKDIKIGTPSVSAGGVQLCTADDAMRMIGDAFELNLSEWRNDRTVRSIMRDQLK